MDKVNLLVAYVNLKGTYICMCSAFHKAVLTFAAQRKGDSGHHKHHF
jgi:hypothetical protein